jgi:hypothetical protein
MRGRSSRSVRASFIRLRLLAAVTSFPDFT